MRQYHEYLLNGRLKDYQGVWYILDDTMLSQYELVPEDYSNNLVAGMKVEYNMCDDGSQNCRWATIKIVAKIREEKLNGLGIDGKENI